MHRFYLLLRARTELLVLVENGPSLQHVARQLLKAGWRHSRSVEAVNPSVTLAVQQELAQVEQLDPTAELAELALPSLALHHFRAELPELHQVILYTEPRIRELAQLGELRAGFQQLTEDYLDRLD